VDVESDGLDCHAAARLAMTVEGVVVIANGVSGVAIHAGET
jgi:hypothetical protein